MKGGEATYASWASQWVRQWRTVHMPCSHPSPRIPNTNTNPNPDPNTNPNPPTLPLTLAAKVDIPGSGDRWLLCGIWDDGGEGGSTGVRFRVRVRVGQAQG